MVPALCQGQALIGVTVHFRCSDLLLFACFLRGLRALNDKLFIHFEMLRILEQSSAIMDTTVTLTITFLTLNIYVFCHPALLKATRKTCHPEFLPCGIFRPADY